MTAIDHPAQRLFLKGALASGASLPLDRAQANYVLNVLRLQAGAALLVFNGTDGEWLAHVVPDGRKAASLVCRTQIRPQPPQPDIDYLFAPIKHARLDYMVQKAVEMGAGRLRPVITRRTQVSRVNMERMCANVIEAAEQCGILAMPEVLPEVKLEQALNGLGPERRLVFCDENAPLADPVAALRPCAAGPLAVLIGPEGGFSPEERALLLAHGPVVRLSLGPRILRADTAAVAALALVQAVRGDLQ